MRHAIVDACLAADACAAAARDSDVAALRGIAAACGASNPKPAGAGAAAAPPVARSRRSRPSAHPRPSTIPFVDADCRLRSGTSRPASASSSRATSTGARSEFDQAVDVLLESPYGGRTEPRIREHFDRLVDRISAYEMTALAQGDGFTEKTVRAGVDRRAAGDVATFADAGADAETEDGRQGGSRSQPSTTFRFRSTTRVLSYIELFQGRLHDFIAGGHEARQRSTCR